MSGFSASGPCPNCGEECDQYTDWKPFSYTSMQCNHCGLLVTPVVSYMSLDELNTNRQEEWDNDNHEEGEEFVPLTELPKQDFKY